MRKIKYIVLHCSATKEGVPFGIEDIDRCTVSGDSERSATTT